MANRNITTSIEDDLYEKLNHVPNKSQLINQLLHDHFKRLGVGDKKLSLEQIKARKEEIDKRNSEKIKEDQEALKELKELETEINSVKENEAKVLEKKRIEAINSWTNYIQFLFIVDEDKARKVAEDYWLLRDEVALYDYCTSVKLVDREENTEKK